MKRIISFLFVLFFFGSSIVFSSDKPKNIIIMIGDGMGLNYVSASVLTDSSSPFFKFKSIGLSITRSLDNLITDSGAGGTAISTGYKVPNKAIAKATAENDYHSIFTVAKSLGKSTGLAVTSTITHATPAAFYANVMNRSEEKVIANQLVKTEVDVAIGGGTKFFTPLTKGGVRDDEKDLLAELSAKGYTTISDFNALKDVDSDKIIALLEFDELKPAAERSYSLKELVASAINNLSKNENGFVLMVEGSQIDWAGHDHKSDYLLSELNDFAEAVDYAYQFVKNDGNSLLVVTADHETGGMAITGGKRSGEDLKLSFTTKGHSAEMVGVFAFGQGEDTFKGVYENNMIGRKMINLFDPNFKWDTP